MSAFWVICLIAPLIAFGLFMTYALCAAAARGDAMIEDALRDKSPR